MEKKNFLEISYKKIGKNEFIDLYAHLAEFEVLKYLPSFPYWMHVI